MANSNITLDTPHHVEELILKKGENILLFDASYYVFYRYFATLRWYGFQISTDDVIDYDNLHNNEVFINAFTKHMNSEFVKLRKNGDFLQRILIILSSV
jgi:hypothetical protein